MVAWPWSQRNSAAAPPSPPRSASSSPEPEPVPLTPEKLAEIRHQEARRIDEIIDGQHAVVEHESLLQTDWQPDITKDSADYIRELNRYRLEARMKSLQALLEDNFGSKNKYKLEQLNSYALTRPSETTRTIIAENTKLYKASLQTGGAFAGEPDNIGTKLALMHFGRPIEPLTLANVRCLGDTRWEWTMDNDPDPPLEPARVQRIIYSEKPLEFLETYHERSFGFPIIRRPKPVSGGLLRSGPAGPIGPADDDSDEEMWDEEVVRSSGAQLRGEFSTRGGMIDSDQDDDTADDAEETNNELDDTEPEVLTYASAQVQQAAKGSDDGHFIYSYFGRCTVSFDCTKAMFLETLLRLLHSGSEEYLHQDKFWECTIDWFDGATVSSSEDLYSDSFHSKWINGLQEKVNDPRFVAFVRPIESDPPRSLMPGHRDDIIVVHGLSASDRGYWKVDPKFRAQPEQFGINEAQHGFSRAAGVALGSAPIPVAITSRSGPASLACDQNLTHEIWHSVWENAPRPLPSTIQLEEIPCPIGDHITLYRIAAGFVGVIPKGASAVELYQEISEALKIRRQDHVGGKTIVFWSDPEYKGELQLGNMTAARIEDALGPILADLENAANPCLIIGFKIESPLIVKMDVVNTEVERGRELVTLGQLSLPSDGPPTLEEFKTWLRMEFRQRPDTPTLPVTFELSGPVRKSNRNEFCTFVISPKTTEADWTTYIYGRLSDRTIVIKLDTTKQTWSPVEDIVRPGLLQGHPPHSSRDWWGDTRWEMGTSGSGLDTRRPPSPEGEPAALPAGGSARFNKARFLATSAQKAKIPKWDTWMTEQHRQDDLQRKSWYKDQRTIEPGQKPEPPVYGESRDLMLAFGDGMPTVYAQRLTPTDIAELAAENQRFRNAALNRSQQCPLCTFSSEAYNDDKIKAHMATHLQQLQREPSCPACGDASWSMMSVSQQKEHMAEHSARDFAHVPKTQFADLECPLCDEPLAGLDSPAVLLHVGQHAVGVLKYCDHCAFRVVDATPAEWLNHNQLCLEADPSTWDDRDAVFCVHCGRDVTMPSSDENKAHVRDCSQLAFHPRSFHSKCGLETTKLTFEENAMHEQSCVSYGGRPGTYCRRCGEKLMGLSPTQKKNHAHVCAYKKKSASARVDTREEAILRKEQAATAKLREANRIYEAKQAAAYNSRDLPFETEDTPPEWSDEESQSSFSSEDQYTAVQPQVYRRFDTRSDDTGDDDDTPMPEVKGPIFGRSRPGYKPFSPVGAALATSRTADSEDSEDELVDYETTPVVIEDTGESELSEAFHDSVGEEDDDTMLEDSADEDDDEIGEVPVKVFDWNTGKISTSKASAKKKIVITNTTTATPLRRSPRHKTGSGKSTQQHRKRTASLSTRPTATPRAPVSEERTSTTGASPVVSVNSRKRGWSTVAYTPLTPNKKRRSDSGYRSVSMVEETDAPTTPVSQTAKVVLRKSS